MIEREREAKMAMDGNGFSNRWEVNGESKVKST